MTTTHEKITEAVAALASLPLDSMPADVRGLLELAPMVSNLFGGRSPLELLIPDDPADADVMVDKALGFIVQLRGDDLAPFRLLLENGDVVRLVHERADAAAAVTDEQPAASA